jgi:kynurenine 3-monooxygenase
MQEIVIAGAGLCGTLLAIVLARRGHRVDVYERRPDMRGERADLGRSINLALSERGARALEQVGLLDRVLANAVPMKARAIHSVEGKIAFQAFGRTEREYLSAVERHTLNNELLSAAEEYPAIELHFNQRLTGIDLAAMKLTFTDAQGPEGAAGAQVTHERPFRSLVATDGVRSAARKIMSDAGLCQFATEEMAYGYKELSIPEEQARDQPREYLHIWPRERFFLLGNPNPDGSISCTLFMPHEGEPSFSRLKTSEDVEGFFQRYFPDAFARMPTLTADFFSRPMGALPAVKVAPWHFEDKLLLLGDAAHGITPFFAQGMNSAFEDCSIFNACLERSKDRLDEAFPAFFKARKADADAIADMALQNYHEIQDQIADPRFLLRKRIEQEVMRRYPQLYTSMHVLVMFTRAPYAFAKACGKLQGSLLEAICAPVTSMDQIDWTHVEALLSKYVEDVQRQAALFQVDL